MKLDYSRDLLLSDFGVKTLEDRYMIATEKSPQEAFARAAMTFASDTAHAQRLLPFFQMGGLLEAYQLVVF